MARNYMYNDKYNDKYKYNDKNDMNFCKSYLQARELSSRVSGNNLDWRVVITNYVCIIGQDKANDKQQEFSQLCAKL